MNKRKKIFLWLIVYFIMISAGLLIYFSLFKKSEPKQEPPINEIKVTNSIEEYGYFLEDRDTELFKEKFENLKTLLNQEEYDKEEYIKLISELFIIDLYTIKNKISRYDVGGLEYVYSKAVESFRSVAQNSIYKTVENNLDDTRTQSLPIVTSITAGEIAPTSFIMPDETTVDGYKVNLSWEYEKDLGYDTSAVLILIPDEKKIGVVFYKPKN